jgi:hypothetical protein
VQDEKVVKLEECFACNKVIIIPDGSRLQEKNGYDWKSVITTKVKPQKCPFVKDPYPTHRCQKCIRRMFPHLIHLEELNKCMGEYCNAVLDHIQGLKEAIGKLKV